MLILTRRVGESIVVGSDVMLTVLSVRGNQARLGIKAPSNIQVDRQDVNAESGEQGSSDSVDNNASSS